MLNPTDLRKIPFFNALKPATFQAIVQYAFIREVRAGADLVSEGMPVDHCYFLLTGHVRVLRMSLEGRVQVLERFGPGAPLNIIPLLIGDDTNQATIETLSPVSVIVLDANAFNRLIAIYPDFSVMLLRKFAERMKIMTNLAVDLSFHTLRIRLARLLIELADQP